MTIDTLAVTRFLSHNKAFAASVLFSRYRSGSIRDGERVVPPG